MRWGSLSSQVRGLKVILANGTLLELADPAGNMHLWRALGVSVGRLGVIAELTLRIVPQRAVEKRLQDLDFDEFAAQVAETADAYAAAVAAGDPAAVDAALLALDETQAFWHLVPLGGNATGAVWRVDFSRGDKLPGGVVPNVSLADPAVAAMDGPPEGAPGAFAALPFEPLAAAPEITTDPEYWAQVRRRHAGAATWRLILLPSHTCTRVPPQFYRDSLRAFVAPGTFPARKAYLATTEASTYLGSTLFPYDQYEVRVARGGAAPSVIDRSRRRAQQPLKQLLKPNHRPPDAGRGPARGRGHVPLAPAARGLRPRRAVGRLPHARARALRRGGGPLPLADRGRAAHVRLRPARSMHGLSASLCASTSMSSVPPLRLRLLTAPPSAPPPQPLPARRYVNVEDYISRSSGAPNAEFQRVIELLRAAPECGGGRLHWGEFSCDLDRLSRSRKHPGNNKPTNRPTNQPTNQPAN
jgi:hypothetical protein